MGEMSNGRKIMVAIDESEESFYALSWCLKNLIVTDSNSNDHLVVLHAKRPVIVYPGMDNSVILSHDVLSSLDRRDRDMAIWVLQKAEKLCNQYDVKMESMIEDGDPRDVICKMVKAMEVDLLVIGSHGYGIITRTILGSVSSHCVQHASCPVLVVKTPKPDGSAVGVK